MKTPLDYATDYFNAFRSLPKNDTEVKEVLGKMQRVLETEGQNVTDMWQAYAKASTTSSSADINTANKKAQEVFGTVTFAGLLLLPGAFFYLPALIDLAKQNGIELVPESIKKEFKI